MKPVGQEGLKVDGLDRTVDDAVGTAADATAPRPADEMLVNPNGPDVVAAADAIELLEKIGVKGADASSGATSVVAEHTTLPPA